jgi:hypothetical protein
VDFGNKGFGTDTDFYPLGTMSGATNLPNGKNGYFQPLNSSKLFTRAVK